MKLVGTLAQIFLGLIFAVFGLNGFFHFIPMPPPKGVAGQFMGAIFSTHYFAVIFATQLVGGLLLLAGRFVPLGLALLGPVLVNIVTFHATMAPHGYVPAVVSVVLWLIVFFRHRAAFAPLFRA